MDIIETAETAETATRVNVALLRKAVEWVEAQAQLPAELREWDQMSWVTPERERIAEGTGVAGCGTAYCVAGWVAMQKHPELADAARAWVDGVELTTEHVALQELGLEPAVCGCGCDSYDLHPLFRLSNTAADVRRIAEELAGERL